MLKISQWLVLATFTTILNGCMETPDPDKPTPEALRLFADVRDISHRRERSLDRYIKKYPFERFIGCWGVNTKCWDVNADGRCALVSTLSTRGEDLNHDGACDNLDCELLRCWDLNHDTMCQLDDTILCRGEDTNGDGVCDMLDCPQP